jgi:hypothetical protein
MVESPILSIASIENKTGTCLACGKNRMKHGRRYCSKDCREQVLWVLSLSKGLLKVFNARYAAFSFDDEHVILDILPVWAKDISRFMCRRSNGKKPAEDLKELVLQSGEEWYHLIHNRNSRSSASLLILRRNNTKRVRPESIKPDRSIRPRFSRGERESMKLLKLRLEELISEGHVTSIKSAYRKLAKIHHPDVGGDAEKFKKLNEAHTKMLIWADNPQFTTKKALEDCWSYDGATNRWTPPL